jgi:hypothetical protein
MPAARFIRLAARTVALGSIVGARVGRRAGEDLTAGRKMSVRTAKPKSAAPGVTTAAVLRVIVCPCAERELAGVFSRRHLLSPQSVDIVPSVSRNSGHDAPITVAAPVRPMDQLFPLGHTLARTCLALFFNTLPNSGSLVIMVMKFFASSSVMCGGSGGSFGSV